MSEASPSPVAVRAACPVDLGPLVELCAAHAAYERADYHAAGKAERLEALLFGASPRLFCTVAAREGALVGYATWAPEVSTWDAEFYAHMDCLYLGPEARGGGTGRRLVAQVALDALAAGCRLVQWQTPAFNTRAMPFYERLGATRRDKARFFLDAEAMEALARPSR